jgi:hypothetical protein
MTLRISSLQIQVIEAIMRKKFPQFSQCGSMPTGCSALSSSAAQYLQVCIRGTKPDIVEQ